MELIVEPGSPEANSYVDIDFADLYFQERFLSGYGWSGYSEEEKIARLIHATRIIDRFRFVGGPTDRDQALAFPRRADSSYCRLKILGRYLGTDVIPENIKFAQVEIALVVFNEDGHISTPGNVTPDGAKIVSEKLKDWSITYSDNSIDCISLEALKFLEPYLADAVSLLRE